MGSDELSFLPPEIGTHSNRAACAMAMYLNGVCSGLHNHAHWPLELRCILTLYS
jgi:hypothetical protein